MKKKICAVLACLLLFAGAGQGGKAETVGNQRTLGTWMWDVTDILRPEEAIAFLSSHHVTEVYLSYSRAMLKSKYRAFISLCAAKGIRVAAIGAEADWVLPEGGKRLESFFKWFKEYQEGCQEDSEKFYGIHMDVEPHQLDAWKEDQQSVQDAYAAFLVKAKAFCDEQKVSLEADIPFWFDGLYATLDGQKISLGEAALRLCDTTLIMSYRDNAEAILRCGDVLLPKAKELGKRMILAVETGKIYEEINITFYHLGLTRLYAELDKLYGLVAQADLGEVGYAIHYYQSWKNLPEDGHPKETDYPWDNPNYQ